MIPDAEQDEQNERVWSFPQGMLDPDDSIKGFHVETTDGNAGKVSWASYAPGESYVVITDRHHLRAVHRVVPASAVERIDKSDQRVWLRLTQAQFEEAPEHHDPPAPLDSSAIDAIRSATASWPNPY